MCVCVCFIPLIIKAVCVIRIGELREVMDDILHKQCDYDPASGENYDFDRFVTLDVVGFFIFYAILKRSLTLLML